MADRTKRKNEPNDILLDLSAPKTPTEYLRIFFSGFAMGASDIVPGVSGGTMAFILGIYETLIDGIKSFNMNAIQKLMAVFNSDESDENKTTLMDVVDHLHLRFLIALGFGLLTAVLLLSSLLEGWLVNEPTNLFSFFAGLIIASVIAIGAKIRWGVASAVALIVGTIIAYLVTNPQLGTLGDQFGHGYPILFVSGMIAICAMILPGVSGSFLLLVLGQYDFILGAVDDRDFASLFFVAAGCGVGILAFSRVLSWLLDKYENTTVALLVGFMVGSMRLIYYRATHAVPEGAELGELINFTTNEIIIAVGFIAAGFIIVTVIDHIQSRANPILAPFDKGAKPINATVD